MFISYNFCYLDFIWIIFKSSYMVFSNIINYIFYIYILYCVGAYAVMFLSSVTDMVPDFWIFTSGDSTWSDNTNDNDNNDDNTDTDDDNTDTDDDNTDTDDDNTDTDDDIDTYTDCYNDEYALQWHYY